MQYENNLRKKQKKLVFKKYIWKKGGCLIYSGQYSNSTVSSAGKINQCIAN